MGNGKNVVHYYNNDARLGLHTDIYLNSLLFCIVLLLRVLFFYNIGWYLNKFAVLSNLYNAHIIDFVFICSRWYMRSLRSSYFIDGKGKTQQKEVSSSANTELSAWSHSLCCFSYTPLYLRAPYTLHLKCLRAHDRESSPSTALKSHCMTALLHFWLI